MKDNVPFEEEIVLFPGLNFPLQDREEERPWGRGFE